MCDPAQRDKTVGKHIGTHPTIIEEAIGAKSWLDYIDLLHEQIHAHHDSDELYIVFVCNKGRHRSEARRYALTRILGKAGYKVTTDSICEDSWLSHGCQAKGLGKCSVCNEKNKGQRVKELIGTSIARIDLLDEMLREKVIAKDFAEAETIAKRILAEQA